MAEERLEPLRASTRSGALSLTYDGGDLSHIELAIPALLERNLGATFFLPSLALLERPREWMAASGDGFEMASHSLRGFTDARGNLPNWTQDMVEEDLRMSRKLLTELFPHQTDFAFAFPGPECGCVKTPYDPIPCTYDGVVSRLFRVAKRAEPGTNSQAETSFLALKSFDTSGMTARNLQSLAERAIEERSWAVLSFAGIGSGEFGIDRAEHDAFLDWLAGRKMGLELVNVFEYANRLAVPASYQFGP